MRRSGSRFLGFAGSSALSLLLGACAGGPGHAQIQGRIASGGGFLGAWDFYPERCAVRRDEVVLLEDNASREEVRLVDRARMPSTRNAKIDVHVAKQTSTGMVDLIFTDPACVKSDLRSGPKGYGGNVAIDCVTGEGGRVVGNVSFQGCR